MTPKRKLLGLLVLLAGCIVLVRAASGIPLTSSPISQTSLVPAEPATFERVGRWLEESRLTEAAADLERLAGSELAPGEEEILIRALEAARERLSAPAIVQDPEDSLAARRVRCLARAYFPEELPLREGETPEPMKVGGDVTRPEFVSGPRPDYTPEATQARVTGTVILKTLVDREGCVRGTQILKGLPFGLSEAAAAAVRNWTFKPALYRDQPVAVNYILTVNFQAAEDEKGEASE